jgi:ornithine cyclodeaminase/alanine dehydrogenase-like protein (mu-crystallin family)
MPNAREIDDTTLARAGIIIVESLQQAKHEAGDLLMAALGIVDWNTVIELGSAIANGGSKPRNEGDVVLWSLSP